jgi:biopolymer transport protein ExbB
MAYNAFTRGNRVLNAKLDAFAFELLTFLSMGQSLRTGQGTEAANVRALRTAAA